MNENNRIIWEPLGEPTKFIRVFELSPGEPDSMLQLRLHRVDLSKIPKPRLDESGYKYVPDNEDRSQYEQYHCISYCWGTDLATEPIVLNGQPHQMRRNLWNMVRRLRLPDRSRYLWADAICINQNDLIEKGHQVSIIGEIFHKASETHIWLGEEFAGSAELFEAVEFRYTYYPTTTLSKCIKQINRLRCMSSRLPSQIDYTWGASRVEYKRLALVWAHLMKMSYWNRTWIVQEVTLSRTVVVHCGDSSLPWHQIRSLDRIFQDFLFSRPEFRSTTIRNGTGTMIHALYTISRRFAQQWDDKHYHCLNGYVELARHTECTDVRDKVYAIIPLTDFQSSMAVDYSIAPVDLFYRVLSSPLWLADEDYQGCLESFRRALKLSLEDVAACLQDHREVLERLNLSEEKFLGYVREGIFYETGWMGRLIKARELELQNRCLFFLKNGLKRSFGAL